MKQPVPLLLLPGLLCNESLFEPIYKELPEGVAPYCVRLKAANTMQEMAKEVLDKAPEQFLLGGLSMGGILAFEVYRQAPERVLGLVLMDTNSADEVQAVTDKRNILVNQAKAGEFDNITPDILMPVLIHPSRLVETNLTDRVTAMATDIGLTHFIAHAEAIGTRADSRPLLSKITVPTLVMTGSDDLLCPMVNHTLINDTISESELHVIDGCGHLSTMEKPQQVGSILSHWLTSKGLAGNVVAEERLSVDLVNQV
ncbi:alpha/beta fold hydrolase [Vibrio sp. SS-MA-C1-2]|uniref:alpha/beta fold hydrolase n=1 Tax=Vibrio sp. SS-MA-C1-2 TaxID=2908646 RepID=UPI0038FD05BC